MIESIHITNYQSHELTSIDLHPGVNVLLGPSRSGKSAVLRALRWLLENKTPASFRSHWGGDTEVALMVDGKGIKRGRTKKANFYSMEGMDPFEKVGAGNPPDEVMGLLDVSPISLQWQHDSPFLLSENPGEVARVLNKAVKLGAIDEATSKITSLERQTGAELRTREGDLEQAEQALERFEGLDGLDGRVGAAEGLELNIRKDSLQLAALENAVAVVGTLEDELIPVRGLATVELSGVIELAGEIEAKRRQLDWLDDTLADMDHYADQLTKARAMLQREDAIERLDGLWDGLEGMREEHAGLGHVVGKVRRTEIELAGYRADLELLEGKLEDAMPDDACPLCGRSCSCLPS